MRILNIVFLIIIFIFGVFQMRSSSSVLKTDWFKSLSYNEKINTTGKVKANWKRSIILLAITICEMLILISSFIGKNHNHEDIINISAIVTISLIINNQKLNKELKK